MFLTKTYAFAIKTELAIHYKIFPHLFSPTKIYYQKILVWNFNGIQKYISKNSSYHLKIKID